MERITIDKFIRTDIKEVVLPTLAEFKNYINIKEAAWTAKSGDAVGKYYYVYNDHNHLTADNAPMNYTYDIYPVFVVKDEINIFPGTYYYVGTLMCLAVDKSRLVSIKKAFSGVINHLVQIDWTSGFSFNSTDIYKRLNSNEFWESIGEPNYEEELKFADEFADELDEIGRMYDDPNRNEVVCIYYCPEGGLHDEGKFVLERYSYELIKNSIFECSTLDEAKDYIWDNRELDECFDRGEDWYLEFASEWAKRDDYLYRGNEVIDMYKIVFGEEGLKNILSVANRALYPNGENKEESV